MTSSTSAWARGPWVAWMALVAWMVLVACGTRSAAPPPSTDSPLLGKPLPRLAPTMTGARLAREQLLGHVVVIEFFAEYCEPCQRTLPSAQHLHEAHPDVIFLGVSLDERQSDLDATIRRHQLTFPIIFDRARVVAGRFRVAELPVTFVIHRDGHIHWVLGPDQAAADLERALDSLDP